jgi:cystathionine beta-synthase
MKYYNNVLELVGNTPLIKINKLTKGFKSLVLGKLESFNPGASVKDRVGISIIEDAEKRGKIKPGDIIVEATSGNTGIGLALTAAIKGYKSIIVVSEKVSKEKKAYLKALGAEIVIVSKDAKPDEPEYYINKAKRIAAETENAYYANQYGTQANPDVHYKTTGPEIWEDTDGKITHLIAGIGTGGTITGSAKFLKEKNPEIKIICADPIGSITKTFKETGKISEAHPYLIEGIGADMIPEILKLNYVDEIVDVSDKDSINTCRKLSREEGIFCGASTGTLAHIALKIAKDLDENGVVVFFICDTGERYLSKYFSEDWLKENYIID